MALAYRPIVWYISSMPRTPPGATRARILEFVSRRLLGGAPPSVREVQEHFGFRSTATVREHLDALVAEGALEQDSGRDRGWRLPGAHAVGRVPLVGRVRAGSLSEAVELADGYVPVDARDAEDAFALRVIGESMAGREIHDGDLVLVRRNATVRDGDVVVALIGEEATLKTYRKRGRQVIFEAANPDYADIVPDTRGPDVRILGRVYEVRRCL